MINGCNDLGRFLMEKRYSSKLVWKEVLWERKKSQEKTNKQTFNATCYAVFRHLKSQLKESHVIFSCDVDHRKLFSKIPIIGFKNNKKLNHIS